MNTKSVSARYFALREQMQRDNRTCPGMIVLGIDGRAEAFHSRNRWTITVLDNLDLQPADAFDVSVNHHGEIVVRETRPLPLYPLI